MKRWHKYESRNVVSGIYVLKMTNFANFILTAASKFVGFHQSIQQGSSYMLVNLRTVEPSLIPTTVGPQRHYRALCLWIPWRKLYPALLYSERAQRCQIFYRMHYDFSFIPLNFLKFPYPGLACFLWTFTIGWQIFIQKYNVNVVYHWMYNAVKPQNISSHKESNSRP